MSKLNVDQKTIKNLLSDNKADFLIPDYQRPYAWDAEKECFTLWEDVFAFAIPEGDADRFDRTTAEYYLGPIGIMTYNVPHFYVQVFFDKVYGVSFQHILELVSNPDLEDVAYSVITHDKDNNKSEIEIKLNQCWSIGDVKELPTMFTKETSNKKASYTCFEGGKIAVNINKLTA